MELPLSLPVVCGIVTLARACLQHRVRRTRRASQGHQARLTRLCKSSYPTNVYFGDTHVHTGLSADAGGGGTTLMPRGLASGSAW